MADIEEITSNLEKFCSKQEKQGHFTSSSKFSNIPGKFTKYIVEKKLLNTLWTDSYSKPCLSNSLESLDAILHAIAANGQLPYR